MQLKPIGDKIIVEVLKAESKSKGGIILPDTAKEKPHEGNVVAVGSGKLTASGKTVAPDVKPGDKILFGKYAGNEVKVDGKEYLIINQDDILAVIK
ncbi:MAG: co-chaperone GroES [Candidatus Omnitrophica bacterium]|nr:co-chaperone GroES [Candidatus Omnitrophota bacterium]